MKRSKTPLWKKSCLAAGLGWENVTDWLIEVGENGDMYGYEDTSVEGYYNEYKDLFDDLSAGAWGLYEAISEHDGYQGYSLREVWDDMTVGLLGDLFTVYGYDAAELDYFKLNDEYEEALAVEEAQKRLGRFTKSELIKFFRKVLMTIVMFYDLKAAHDCLTSIVEELDEKGALLERKNDTINRLYEDLTGKNAKEFDDLIAHLPQRMWVE